MSSNDAAHVAADVASKFDSRIITFLVGPQKIRFRIHDNVLRQAQAGNFLGKAFCDGFRDIKELPDDGPAEFQFFVNSLYRVWTESTELPFKCENLKVPQKLKLYAFAHKYACHDFQNAIISSIYHFEPQHVWRNAICREDLERLVADVPDGSPMHRILTDWLLKDMFDMHPGVNHIADEFLEGLPEFLLRAALKHMLTYSFPRSLNKKMPLKMRAKGNYLLTEDNQVRERKLEPLVDVQGLLAGDAGNAVPCPRPPAGGWRHASAPPASKKHLQRRD
ncbi:hypothetical protein INS49_011640 [Diaporthe citri]|uniref:uncharacterized protein n=1 Tax=Diaporthe citri TaxID=83186 RepID=UPI001C7E5879|nr:uncharacterized protein INS49_011640 [Diaporthe citri]KAG6360578.1 hypothetical protein INS49_011640 [Diaporthe citri]